MRPNKLLMTRALGFSSLNSRVTAGRDLRESGKRITTTTEYIELKDEKAMFNLLKVRILKQAL